MTNEFPCATCFKPVVTESPQHERMVTHPRTHPEQYRPGCPCCACKLQRKRAEHQRAWLEPHEVKRAENHAEDDELRFWIRLSVNAMLWPREVVALKREQLVEAIPCAVKLDGSLVELDCKTIHDLLSWRASRQFIARDYRVFHSCERTFHRRFSECLDAAELPDYPPSILRATGIRNRVVAARTMDELDYVRQCARMDSLKSLAPYLDKTIFDKLKLNGRVKWA